VDPVNRAFHLWVVLLLSCIPMMSQSGTHASCDALSNEVVATRAPHELLVDAAHPAAAWDTATPVTFCSDWQGKNRDPERQTQVRVLWSPSTFYLRFECHYRELHVFADSDPNGRRDQLWDRDVAEAFLQPEPSQPHAYKEFEISPNGMWIDLDISQGAKPDLKSGLQRSVVLDEKAHTWSAELAIPMRALTDKFDPSAIWRVNFYRVEGKVEPRGYYAWQPTHTPQPNFHVPSVFGRMRFAAAKK
jgi:Carbohydrate family 9 binding domain-like